MARDQRAQADHERQDGASDGDRAPAAPEGVGDRELHVGQPARLARDRVADGTRDRAAGPVGRQQPGIPMPLHTAAHTARPPHSPSGPSAAADPDGAGAAVRGQTSTPMAR